jgi:hypothetical protein
MPFRAVTFDLGGVLRPPPESVRNGKWEERFGLPEAYYHLVKSFSFEL